MGWRWDALNAQHLAAVTTPARATARRGSWELATRAWARIVRAGGDGEVAIELNRAGAIAGPRAGSDGSGSLPTRGRQPFAGPFALARSLLAGTGVVAVGLIASSALGLAPLASPVFCLFLLALGVLMSAGILRWAREQEARPASGPAWLDRLGRLALGAGALATILAVALALWLPVGAYDAIGYRLPAIAQWLDVGRWSWVIGDDPLRNGYPLGLELVEAALFGGFGSPAAVDAVAWVFLVAGACAMLGFARQLGLPRGAGELAAGLYLLVPMHLLNAPSGYADAAFAGAMACMAIALARRDRNAWLDLGLAAGWTLALKPHGVVYAGLALASFAVLARDWRRLAGAVALAAPGLAFAARNVLHSGNPVYPLEVRWNGRVILFGRSTFNQILTPSYNVPAELLALPSWLRPLWVWLQPHGPARSYDDRLAGFGYAFVLLALPALLVVAARSLAGRGEVARAFTILCAFSTLCWLLQPFSFWPRFTSWLWAAGGIALALAVSQLVDLGRARAALALVVVSLLLALPEAAYALLHVKHLSEVGPLSASPRALLARVAELEPAFLERALVGKRELCRTPWRLGTDDANLDGVVAQLSPRPRMHVISARPLSRALADAAARGCDALIVIGNNSIAERAPPAWAGRIERLRAFGTVSLVPTDLYEVTP